MTNAVLGIAVMTAIVLFGWFVQGFRQRKRPGGRSAQGGSIGADNAGESHGWFDGHGHSADHGGASGWKRWRWWWRRDGGGGGGGSD